MPAPHHRCARCGATFVGHADPDITTCAAFEPEHEALAADRVHAEIHELVTELATVAGHVDEWSAFGLELDGVLVDILGPDHTPDGAPLIDAVNAALTAAFGLGQRYARRRHSWQTCQAADHPVVKPKAILDGRLSGLCSCEERGAPDPPTLGDIARGLDALDRAAGLADPTRRN